MAMQGYQHVDQTYKFKSIQIFKTQQLGHGSYGAVYKAKCDDLPCAAKLIYPVLFGSPAPLQSAQPQNPERQPMRRFEAECHFLSQIKHPNIVQYLGTHCDPETSAPILLMELMDENLTNFLEKTHGPLQTYVQINFSHDTALALAYLHCNGITHRDLSSNNVLLVAGTRVKVTDFGMSTLTNAASTSSRIASLTQCPGTPVYMPPEALKKPLSYSEKLDCFSFGVLAIQIITRQFPSPLDPFQTREVCDPQFPMQTFQAQVPVPENIRRQSHISLIPLAHPLRSIALDCIKDRESERPTAQKLCTRLEGLKISQVYASSLQQDSHREFQLQTLRQTIEDNQQQIQRHQKIIHERDSLLQLHQHEIVKLKQEVQTLQTQSHNLEEENQRLKLELDERSKQIKSSEELVAEFQDGMTKRDKQIQELQGLLQCLELEGENKKPEVKYKKPANKDPKLVGAVIKCPKAPAAMKRGSSVIIRDVAYFNPCNSQRVYSFHYQTMQWSTLSKCPCAESTLTSVNCQLTTVGGLHQYTSTNKLFTYRDGKWIEQYPPMHIKRIQAAVISLSTVLVVMGGKGGVYYLKSTEVLDLTTSQWCTTSQLPYGIYNASACTVLCGEILFILGGITDSNDYSAASCQLRDLVQSSQSSRVWYSISDLPVKLATCVSLQGQLLAVGGIAKHDKKSNAIYKYDHDTNIWTASSTIAAVKSECFATVLPDDSLLIVGGITGKWYKDDTKSDGAEIYTIV